METAHLTAGARDSERLVRDDRDRATLLQSLVPAVARRGLLAFAVLDIHVHLIVDGSAARACAATRDAVGGYVRYFNARHGRSGALLRGPIEAATARTARELARQIVYSTRTPCARRRRSWPKPTTSSGAARERLPGSRVRPRRT